MDCLCCLNNSKPSIVLDKTITLSITASPTNLIRRSPSQRFGHLSPGVMKRLDPLGKIPEFNPDSQISMAAYKTYQNGIIDRLMRFNEDEKIEL